jgi:hypothetical protein
VEVCPDCGVAIESSTPPLKLVKPVELDDDSDPEWTVAANVPNAIIGNVIKKQLEDAGIPVLMFRSRSADVGEFSHNDYVPQDLRVPRNRWREARELVYAEPDSGLGWSAWGPQFDEDDEPADHESEEEADVYANGYEPRPQKNLPEGWSMLPTERDVSEQQQIRRAHSQRTGEWHWTEARKSQDQYRSANHTGPESQADYGYEQEPREFSRREIADSYSDYGSGPIGTSKWVKVFYAILIGSLTLPFLVQILGQISSMFGNR